jgi:hypothetical protein
MTTTVPTNEQYGAKFLREGVAQRVRRLRLLVDQIEQESERYIQDAEEGAGPYGRAVANIDQLIAWGIANLNMETLAATATDTDIAHAKGD